MPIVSEYEVILSDEVDEFCKKDWFVLHTYTGLENKVKDGIINLIKNSQVIAESVKKVFIPVENVIEIRRGEKRHVSKKIFPGYILLQIDDLNETVNVMIKSVHGVTDFVTLGMDDEDDKSKPIPLPRNEVRNILDKSLSTPTKPKTMYEVGDSVTIINGPFSDFVGSVDEVDIDKAKLKIMVDIFGRKTSVELNFDQVEKQTHK